jgi:glucose-6-phosphate dehydrogenase assembly protein OpcA
MASSVEQQSTFTPKDIEPALAKLRESLTSDEQVSFGVSSTGNIIIVATGANSAAKFSEFQEAFMAAQPTRFFLVELKDIETANFSVNAICHKIGKNDHVCSEIISIETPSSYLPKLASVLRSHITPGVVSECCIADEESLAKVFSSISQVPDLVYLDSLNFRSGIRSVGQVAESTKKLVDLNWLRTSCFREAIRIGFDALKFLVDIENLKSIKITSIQDKQSNVTSSGSLLVAGWLISRLNMQVVSVSGSASGKVECANTAATNKPGNKFISPKSLSILFDEVLLDEQACSAKHTSFGNVYSIDLEFDGQSKQTLSIQTNTCGNIKIKGAGVKDFVMELGVNHENTSAGLLKRMLLIGESQRNFSKSLDVAVEIVNRVESK